MNQRRSASHRLLRATRLVMPPISPIRRPSTPCRSSRSGGRVSNPRPRAWEARALPTELPPRAAHSRSRPRGRPDDEWPLRCHAMEGPETSKIKAVIAHDFSEVYGGAERIVASIAEVFPDAPFWSILGRPSVTRRMGIGDRAHTVLPPRKRLLRGYRALTPLYPAIVRAKRLPPADVLITSTYAFAHGFRTENDAPQVAYCYSPLRFAWSMTGEYEELWAEGAARGAAFRGLAALMRAADRRAAQDVTTYVAESEHIADQIRRFYGREPEVIYPPVDCELFTPDPSGDHDDYFLICGRLIEPYKRFGIAVDAFRELPHRLLVAGDGPAYSELVERAGDNVEFLGHLSDDDLVP